MDGKISKLIQKKAQRAAKIIFTLIWLILFAEIHEASAGEKVNSYHVHININRDSSIDVLESIEYDFGTELKKGIYRTIPIVYEHDEKMYSLDIVEIEAFDDEGNDQLFDILRGDRELRVDLGSDVKEFTGSHTFHLGYRAEAALIHEDETDVLHWNAIGTKWNVSINNPSVTIELPSPVKKEKLENFCYVGHPDSPLLSSKTEYEYDVTNDDRVSRILYSHEQTLNPGEGVTVELRWPKGIVEEARKREIPPLPLLFWLFMGAIALIPYFGLFKVFRSSGDPIEKGPVLIKTDVPEELTPSNAGTLLKRTFTNKHLVAVLLSLAIRGYIKIIEGQKGLFYLNKLSFLILRLKDPNGLSPTEKTIMEKIFDSRFSLSYSEAIDYFKQKPAGLNKDLSKALDITSPEEFKNSHWHFTKSFKAITKKSKEEVLKKGYFAKPFLSSRLSGALTVFFYFLGAAVTAALLLGATAYFYSSLSVFMILHKVLLIAFIYTLILSIVIYKVVKLRLPPRTKNGAEMRRHLLGLKRYLKGAKNLNIEDQIDPGSNLEYFEKLLPYAIVLGRKNKLIKHIPEETYDPLWYGGNRRGFINTKMLNRMINSISTSSGAGGGGTGGGVGGGGGGSR